MRYPCNLYGQPEGVATDHFRIVFAQSRSVREVQREIRKLAPDLLVIATGNHAAVDCVMRASVGNDSCATSNATSWPCP
jgi:hypothetical protein